MKILVTGGAGFIGGNFVHYMVNKYPEDMIVNLDKLTYAGNLETCKPVEGKPNYKFVKGDIADREFIFDLFKKEKFDVVVNFAAESHVDRSIEDPEIFVKTNVMGTTTLLDACNEFGIKRYHQVSTDEVYGDLRKASALNQKTEKRPSEFLIRGKKFCIFECEREKTRTNHMPIDMRSLCFFGRFAQVERHLQRYGYNSLGRNLFTFSVAL